MQRAYAFMERIAALIVLCTVMSIGAPRLAVAADPGLDGNPFHCGIDISSFGSIVPLAALNITSRCDKLDVGAIATPSKGLTRFIEETGRGLWDSGRLPKGVLYHYALSISNDSTRDIDLSLINRNVAHSPYIWMAKSFSYRIPACSLLVLKFYSPWAPSIEEVPINVGLSWDPRHYGREHWGTIGAGRASILVPIWFQYFPDGFGFERIPASKARTEICRANH